MKKALILIIIVFWSIAPIFSQRAKVIRITQTQIIVPDTLNLDTLTKGEQSYIKLIIKNDRNNTIEIKNIIAPPGAGIMLEKQSINPKSQSNLYVGFDTGFMDKIGNFVYKFTLETNLIKPIEFYVKGFIVPDDQ